MHTLLLFGATGQIGSALSQMLLKHQVPFKAIVRDFNKAKHLRHTHVELIEGDLENRDLLKKSLKGVEKVFLCSSADPNQAELQGNAVEIAYHAGVKHLVKISALGTDKESPVGLLRWHAQTEEQIKNYHLPYTFLRPHMFMEGVLGFAPSIREHHAFYAPLKAKVSLVAVQDIAEVAFKALTTPHHLNQTYTITGPKAVSYQDMAQILSEKTGKSIQFQPTSYEEAKKAMAEHMPPWLVEDLVALQKLFNMGIADFVSPTVEDVTGHSPMSFQQWLEPHLRLFK